MSILINEKTRILVQGITGDKGSFHAREMVEYASNVVAASPRARAGRTEHGVRSSTPCARRCRRRARRPASPRGAAVCGADAIMEARMPASG